MSQLKPIEHNGQRILTTSQLAESFKADNQLLINNFNRNKDRYTEGKHFFLLEGQLLKDFRAINQIDFSQNVSRVYMWTERGAWMHAKSLNTDEAWNAYESLVDDYYEVKAQIPQQLSLTEIVAVMAQQLVEREKKDAERDRKLELVADSVNMLADNLITVPDHTKVVSMVNEYARWTRLGQNEVYNTIYNIMQNQHGIDVRERVANERHRINIDHFNQTGKYFAESTLKQKINGIDMMVRMGVLDKFHSILVGLLAKEKGKGNLQLVR